MLRLHDTFEFMRVKQLSGAVLFYIDEKSMSVFIHMVYDKNNWLFLSTEESHVEQHSGDFSVTVRDVRQLEPAGKRSLTLLWVLEGSVNLTGGGRCAAAACRRRAGDR